MYCQRPAENGRNQCSKCLARFREYAQAQNSTGTNEQRADKKWSEREERQRRIRAGLCTYCNTAVTGKFKSCDTCLETRREIQRKRSASRTEEERLERRDREAKRRKRIREAGLCLGCQKPVTGDYKRCAPCRQESRARYRVLSGLPTES